MEERIVKGIWIPIEIWKDKNLTWNEKILLLEIDSYTSNEKDCFISNEYISELLGINETNASKTISSLIKKGYVIKTRFDGRKRYVKSDLSIATTLTCCEEQTSRVRGSMYTDSKQESSTNTFTNKEKVSKKKSLNFSAVSADMMSIVEDWLAYKSEKKQSYKQIGFDAFYKNLCKLSDNNPIIARAIIDQSIGNNYSGIFGLKNGAQYSNISYPRSIDDVKRDDLCDSYNAYVSLMERKCYKMKESIGNGFPQTNSELMRLIEITKGGARGFTYVFLVLNRDGWDKYYDERGFMWIYYNYIKANGLFIG